MRTVMTTQTVELTVGKNDLINGEWIPFTKVSALLKEKEENDSTMYKALRTRLYNSDSGKKYQISSVAGIKCINAKTPMAQQSASLVLSFKIEGVDNEA